MSFQDITFNGQSFSIPNPRATDWGQRVTDFLVAIPSGVLQPDSGLFTITDELDFGGGEGIKGLFFSSREADAADDGFLRLGHEDEIAWRNTANDGNLTLGVDDNDLLTFNGNPVLDGISVIDTNSIDLTYSVPSLSADVNLSGSTLAIDGNGVKVADEGITNTQVNNSAAIVYSKLDLSDGIVNADVNTSAAIAYTKLNLSGSIVNADINSSAAIALTKLAALTASRALVSDGSGLLDVSAVTSTELGYLDGVTSSIQTQLDAKVDVAGDTMTGALGIGGNPDSTSLLDVQSTVKGILLPRLTTIQRDAISSPATGLFIYNVNNAKFNYFDGAEWRTVNTDLSLDLVTREIPTGEINSSNDTFTLANIPLLGSESVYLNGMLQEESTDYNIVDDTITFITAPITGSTLLATYLLQAGDSPIYALKTLGNLAAVAINTSLLPDTTTTIDLGSSAKTWRTLYLNDSSVSQVSIGIGNNTTGIYFIGGDKVGFSRTGTSQFLFDSDPGGTHLRVGAISTANDLTQTPNQSGFILNGHTAEEVVTTINRQVATASWINFQTFMFRVTTTDNTPTLLSAITPNTNSGILVEARVVGRRTGGTAGTVGDVANYILKATFKNISGTVTQVGTTVKDTFEDNTNCDCNFNIDGTTLQVLVTGDTDNNYTWHATQFTQRITI